MQSFLRIEGDVDQYLSIAAASDRARKVMVGMKWYWKRARMINPRQIAVFLKDLFLYLHR